MLTLYQNGLQLEREFHPNVIINFNYFLLRTRGTWKNCHKNHVVSSTNSIRKKNVSRSKNDETTLALIVPELATFPPLLPF